MTIQPDTLLSRQHIRQQIRDRRRALSPEQQRLFAQQAAERMMAWPPIVLAHNVALFLSFDGELDTQPPDRPALARRQAGISPRCCIPLAPAICCFYTTIRRAN